MLPAHLRLPKRRHGNDEDDNVRQHANQGDDNVAIPVVASLQAVAVMARLVPVEGDGLARKGREEDGAQRPQQGDDGDDNECHVDGALEADGPAQEDNDGDFAARGRAGPELGDQK